MGIAERRERERTEVRGKILDAARKLFVEHGYDSVSMRMIAREIEYSPTAIYFHFKDKEALLGELCDLDFRVFAQRFAEAARIADPFERLRAAGHAYVEFGLTHQSHYRVMFMTPKPPHETIMDAKGNPQEDAYEFLKQIIQQALAEKRFRAELTNVDLIAQVTWAGIHGVVSLEIAKCNDPWVDWCPIQDRAKLMIDALIDGMTAAKE